VAVVADVDTATPKLFRVHPDHLDRPVMMTDTAASIVWQAAYLPFGPVHAITGTAANDNRFPGQWYQLESGLSYNWHRHYDPSLGRYTQADPLGLVDGPNRYAYVGNDPMQMIDSRGEKTIIIRWSGSGKTKSRWGHISGGINGKNMSFGPKGWDTTYPQMTDYIDRLRSSGRSGEAVSLNLSRKEERELKHCLRKYQVYQSITNNCGNPWIMCLGKLGVVNWRDQGRVFPPQVIRIIRHSPRVINKWSIPEMR